MTPDKGSEVAGGVVARRAVAGSFRRLVRAAVALDATPISVAALPSAEATRCAICAACRGTARTMRRMSQRITTDDVAHVARLAHLEVSDGDLPRFTEQLSAILDHAADIAALSIADVPPTSHPLALENVSRADTVSASLERDEVLAQAPFAEHGRFRVPPILGDEP